MSTVPSGSSSSASSAAASVSTTPVSSAAAAGGAGGNGGGNDLSGSPASTAAAQQQQQRGGRGAKRKLVQETQQQQQLSKKHKGELSTPTLGPNAFPKEYPFNREPYRYILAEADPHAPFRQEFDESSDLAGKPIPGFLCRVLTPQSVLLSLHDRAQQVVVSEDRLSLTGFKFYCTVRANHSVSRHTWYFETKILDMKEGAATRIGWAQRYANLQAPLGFDKFGYSIRSRKGTRFHEAVGKHYSNGYKEGDYVGCLIELPEDSNRDYLPQSYKDKPLIKFKSHFYFEEKDGVKEAAKNVKVQPDSKITFFKNGECLGTAFTDLYQGDYFPAVASYKNAKVRMNFGPKFRFPPRGFKYKPVSARAEQVAIEQSMADMRFFTEKEGNLSLSNYASSP